MSKAHKLYGTIAEFKFLNYIDNFFLFDKRDENEAVQYTTYILVFMFKSR